MELLEGRFRIDDLDSFVSDLGEVGRRRDVAVQAFDPHYVAGRRHLERAVELADRSIERGENVARDRAVEILLYAAGRRQIDRALEMGLPEGETPALVLVDGDDEGGAISDLEALPAFLGREAVLELRDESVLCDFFEISDAERAATDASLEDLVCERVALLEVEK